MHWRNNSEHPEEGTLCLCEHLEGSYDALKAGCSGWFDLDFGAYHDEEITKWCPLDEIADELNRLEAKMNEEERLCRAIDASVYYDRLKKLQKEISELYDFSENISEHIIKTVEHDYFRYDLFQHGRDKEIEVSDYKRRLDEFDKVEKWAYYLANFADNVLSIYKLEQQ